MMGIKSLANINMGNTNQGDEPRAQWSSLLNYLLVTTGMVIGLGNIFVFPSLVAKHGSLFIICYIVFELLISIPIFLTEALIGRRGKQNPIGSFGILIMESGANRHWRKIGWLCFIVLVLTISYYSVEASFPFAYFVSGVISLWKGVHTATVTAIPNNYFKPSITVSQFLLLLTFLIAAFTVVARGINRGLEGISRIVVPVFFLMLLGLAIYSCQVGNFKAALAYLMHFTLSDFTFEMLFAAFTCAFFELNVGMGTMIVYGSYLPLAAPLGRSTLIVALFDIIASLLAFFIIYPIAILNSTTIPYVSELNCNMIARIFANIPVGSGGFIASLILFFVATIAAWMPTIAIAEGITLTIIERLNIKRHTAALMVAATVIMLAGLVMLSYSHWFGIKFFGTITIGNIFQGITTDNLTLLAALLISIFGGWVIKKSVTSDELGFRPTLFNIWYFLVRYVAPVVCGILLIANIIVTWF